MVGLKELAIMVLLGCLWGYISGILARDADHSFALGFSLGFVLGIIGVLITYILYSASREKKRRAADSRAAAMYHSGFSAPSAPPTRPPVVGGVTRETGREPAKPWRLTPGVPGPKPGDICALHRDVYMYGGSVLPAYTRVRVPEAPPGVDPGPGRVLVQAPRVAMLVLDRRDLVRLDPGAQARSGFRFTEETPFAILTVIGGIVLVVVIALFIARWSGAGMVYLPPLLPFSVWAGVITAFGIWRLASGSGGHAFPRWLGLVLVVTGLWGALVVFPSHAARMNVVAAGKVASVGLIMGVAGIGLTTLLFFITGDRRPCPICGRPVMVEAVKCKHCGSFIVAERDGMMKKGVLG
jgi:MFS family permease